MSESKIFDMPCPPIEFESGTSSVMPIETKIVVPKGG
jgi:hypothetical protein